MSDKEKSNRSADANAGQDAGKLIAGGPMMGIAIYDTAVPVQKSTSGILALKKESAVTGTQCLSCGRCVKACPMGLVPAWLNKNVIMANFEAAEKNGALECVECGSCAYICPAKFNITSNIRSAKRAIMAARRRS